MGVKRMIAILAVLVLLAVGTVTPTPARADSTTDDFIYAGIALGAYIGLVVLFTSVVYGSPSDLALAPADLDVRRDGPQPAVRVAPHCRQTSTSVTLFCW